jgi:hypothetical protein
LLMGPVLIDYRLLKKNKTGKPLLLVKQILKAGSYCKFRRAVYCFWCVSLKKAILFTEFP